MFLYKLIASVSFINSLTTSPWSFSTTNTYKVKDESNSNPVELGQGELFCRLCIKMQGLIELTEVEHYIIKYKFHCT